MKYELDYFSFEENGFHIGGWTRRGWKRFQRSALGTENRPARCTHTTEIELERGNAVIYGAYDGKPPRSCPPRSPDRYYAIAHVGRMVIGLNLALCLNCEPGVGSGPYRSVRGTKAILTALQVRPRPDYAAETASGVAMRPRLRSR